MSGWVRFIDWMLPQKETVAHAFAAGHGLPFRSLCGTANWTVKAVRIERGPLCAVCRSLVSAAANELLEQMVDMAWRESQAALAAVMDVPENESRALWGDR